MQPDPRIRHAHARLQRSPSVPFLRTVVAALVDGRLVEGFAARSQPERLAQATLYLPTRRAGRLVREIFLEELDRQAVLLPRIVALGDIDEDELAFAEEAESYGGAATLELPPKLGELERRLTLARLVAAWAKSPGSAPLVVGGPASTLALAGDLARLMDDMVTRGVGWNALDGLVPDAARSILATHAQVPADRARGLAGASGGNRQDRAGGAARSADRCGSHAPRHASCRPGDRGGFDRIDAGDRKIPARDRVAAARRGGAAGTRYRSRRRGLAEHRRHPRRARPIQRRRRHPTIRNTRCMRCCIASRSTAAMSKFLPSPRRADATFLSRRRCGPRARRRSGSGGWPSQKSPRRFRCGMTNLAVIEADNPETEALAIAVAMREARHLGQIGGAGDAGSRAGAARDRGARPLESRLRRFRRRCADGHACGNFRAARGRSGGKTARAADAAGALEASAMPARWRARRLQDADRGARTGAVARHAAASGKLVASRRILRASALSLCKLAAARHPRCTAPSRGPG